MVRNRKGAVVQGVLVAAALAVGAALGSMAGPGPQEPVTTHGEWVTIGRGRGAIRAYVAYPERKERAPAVIVIHEIFGLTDWEPTVVDRLAKAGYVAIVPDLLSSRFGRTPASADSGRKLTGQLVQGDVIRDLDSVYAYVNRLPAVRKGDVGTIGFCWGGRMSFAYATANPKLKAAVVCYGDAPDSVSLARIRAPILGVYGEDDARINADLPRVESQLRALKKDHHFNIYPGTGHGFLKPGRKGNDGPQPEQAWGDILAFYGKAFGT